MLTFITVNLKLQINKKINLLWTKPTRDFLFFKLFFKITFEVRKIYSGRMILETEYGKADENWELTKQHLEDAVLGIWYNNKNYILEQL